MAELLFIGLYVSDNEEGEQKEPWNIIIETNVHVGEANTDISFNISQIMYSKGYILSSLIHSGKKIMLIFSCPV